VFCVSGMPLFLMMFIEVKVIEVYFQLLTMRLLIQWVLLTHVLNGHIYFSICNKMFWIDLCIRLTG
jgi:hypothetical protein